MFGIDINIVCIKFINGIINITYLINPHKLHFQPYFCNYAILSFNSNYTIFFFNIKI